jgi:heptosyltransferase-2
LLDHNPLINRLVSIDDSSVVAWRKDDYEWVLSLDDECDSSRLAAELKTHRLSGAYSAPDSTIRYTEDMTEWFGMGLLRPESEGGLIRANELKQQNTLSYGTILYKCLNLPLPVARPQVTVLPGSRERVQDWIAGSPLAAFSRIVGINSGAGGRWKYKSWGEEQTAALAAELHRKFGVGVVILGGERERERNQRIKTMAFDSCTVAPADWDIKCFSALIGQCEVVITSDSLALHLAVANSVPAVAFFGPTSAAEIDIFDCGIKVVTDLSCRCCYLSSCDVRPHCMESIEVNHLLNAAAAWLS